MAVERPKSESNGELRPFDPLYAPVVAAWIRSPLQLRWLAPRTQFPLTAAKVVNWTRKTGEAFLLFRSQESIPCGYGELNPMQGDASHLWIGHVVIDIERRRQGLGRQLTELIIRKAVSELGAKKVSLVVFPENKPALDCYLQCGFKVVAEEFQRFDKTSAPQRMIRLGLGSR
ncbi:MAG: hypothetical protein DHS20C16_23850 [Phycisphaerae bacterium]|nr:MAG: hypothetical protein DHS20C16_23850 [Phycisphaerae bacterium]